MFFSVVAGIIPLSLRNAGGGTFDTVSRLVCKWGQLSRLPPIAPGSAAYAHDTQSHTTVASSYTAQHASTTVTVLSTFATVCHK